MRQELEIRDSTAADLDAIETLYPAAFPDEDLLPLVRGLLQDNAVTMSTVAVIDSRIVGHVIFTRCAIAGRTTKAALLGPLAVAPAWQRQGIGSNLARDGLQRLADADTSVVLVLGDPAFYGRLGFLPDTSITPPYGLPAEYKDAWQSLALGDSTTPESAALAVPEQWLQPGLWLP